MAADGSVIIEILGDDSKLSSTLGKLGKTASSAVKGISAAVGAATAATTTAAVAMGKQAIDAYADYEQLVGGVETLFKGSAGIVEEYAANAYKTAGMSANAYMETVTGFSASLLQSLKGDTAAAAEAADMAITDMADNANKMGSSMESIQNAYQGFAKQNYTMLDNLKLGYGGTKEEMERLLADAEKLSGVHYDIGNLNDVYNAIHVIQTEMGITGTTAEEASSTIQGSIASAKAALTNLLTGLADDKQDVAALMDDFVDSVGTALENLGPRVQIVLDNVYKLATENLPQIAKDFGPKLVDALTDGVAAMPELIDAGTSIVESLVSGIIENKDQLVEGAMSAMVAFASGVVELIPTIAQAAYELMMGLAGYVTENAPEMLDAARQTIVHWCYGLAEHIPDIISTAADLILALFSALVDNIPYVVRGAAEVAISIVEALLSVDWLDVGVQIVNGIAEGLLGAVGALVDAAIQAAKDALDAVKDFLGIHSPSTRFRDEVGEQIPPGIGEGMESKMPALTRQVQDELDGLMDQVRGVAAAENGAVGNAIGVRSHPTADDPDVIGNSDRQPGYFGTGGSSGISKLELGLKVSPREMAHAITPHIISELQAQGKWEDVK